ncbi:MAG: hypothetical protein JXM79_01430 [Sedimentisphaerales bacterium]|nr:hypothetical protein [Sedimentisphaerales bacterium]
MAYTAINWFRDTPKTESTFYLRFQTIPAEEKVIFAEIRRVKESFNLFSRLCKWWAVRCTYGSILIITAYFLGIGTVRVEA